MKMTIPSGVRSVKLVLPNGLEILNFMTRRKMTLDHTDRLHTTDARTMAFKIDKAVLVVKSNAVRIEDPLVKRTILEGLRFLSGFEDAEDECAFFEKSDELSTHQLLRGAETLNSHYNKIRNIGRQDIVELAMMLDRPRRSQKMKDMQHVEENYGFAW